MVLLLWDDVWTRPDDWLSFAGGKRINYTYKIDSHYIAPVTFRYRCDRGNIDIVAQLYTSKNLKIINLGILSWNGCGIRWILTWLDRKRNVSWPMVWIGPYCTLRVSTSLEIWCAALAYYKNLKLYIGLLELLFVAFKFTLELAFTTDDHKKIFVFWMTIYHYRSNLQRERKSNLAKETLKMVEYKVI